MNQIVARTAMVDTQIRPADVTRYDILSAFLETKREAYLPPKYSGLAYSETELEISAGRSIMRPQTLAKLINSAKPSIGDDVLLIGGNLGYEAAVLAKLVSSVIVLESDKALVTAAEENLRNQQVDNVVVVKGALERGLAKSAPYSLIIINGAVRDVPKAIFDQLPEEGGRVMAIVEDNGVYRGTLFIKTGEDIDRYLRFDSAAPLLPGFKRAEKFSF